VVVDHLRGFAATLDADIRTSCRVASVAATGDRGFVVSTDDGDELHTAGVVAATGSFGNPYLPPILGVATFTGRLLHVADYRRPEPYIGQRVVVVGAGDSSVQVGYELAQVATVTLATRRPPAFLRKRIDGKDLHHWLERTGFDHLPSAWLSRLVSGALVTDDGRYRAALAAGRPDRRPMFTALEGELVVWSDGATEHVDTIILATGYRPNWATYKASARSSTVFRYTTGHVHHPPRSGLPRHRGSTFLRIEHPARRAPRRRLPHARPGRVPSLSCSTWSTP
jgi:putative flavoprotein involved in K+ transport